MVNKTNQDIIELGRELHAAHTEGDFEAYCRDIPIHYRKARAVMALSSAVDSGRLSGGAVADIGWTKATTIVTASLTKTKTEAAVKFARSNSQVALKNYLEGETHQVVTKAFVLSRPDATALDEALLRSGARKRGRAIIGREAALMSIVRASANTSALR